VNQKQPLSRSARILLGGLGVLFVFTLGIGIGNGRLTLGRLSDLVSRDAVLRTSENTDLPADLDYDTVEKLYDELRESYDGDLSEAELLDGLKQGLVEATGDTYTEYMDAESAKEFKAQMEGTFSGIGAELGKDEQDNLIIIAPISGAPAEAVGLRAKDIILAIDGAETSGMTTSDAVTRIRGDAGTKVKLKIARQGSDVFEVDITRADITIPSVQSKMLDNHAGLIEISRFGDDTVRLAREAANSLRTQGAQRIVLDLRGNPGGTVDSAVGVASLWLDKGEVVMKEKRGDELVKTFDATGDPVLKGMKTVVLIDGGSASASEIVAGALRDHGAATLVGEKSYGKGSVQRVIDFSDGSLLKVTIARWYTPDDQSIDKQGLSPDTEVKLSEDDIKAGRDPQLDAAQKALN
jgi:carboxyl-terminal processing protease